MPLRELRTSLSQMRLNDLAVGPDGRNRALLSAFRSRTGRNQPSNSTFIFGPAVWLRGLIKPEPGNALAYIDWSQQEFGIAAALSGDDFDAGGLFAPVTPILNLQSRRAQSPPMRPRQAMGRRATASRPACLPFSTAWAPRPLQKELGSLLRMPESS